MIRHRRELAPRTKAAGTDTSSTTPEAPSKLAGVLKLLAAALVGFGAGWYWFRVREQGISVPAIQLLRARHIGATTSAPSAAVAATPGAEPAQGAAPRQLAIARTIEIQRMFPSRTHVQRS